MEGENRESKSPLTPSALTGITGRRLFVSSGSPLSPDKSFLCKASTLRNISSPENKGIGTATAGFRPIVPADTLPGASNATTTLPVLLKAQSKYNPPDFMPTVCYMRDKLYLLAGLNPKMHEPPNQRWFIHRWKDELSKEAWFIGENVSNSTYYKFCFPEEFKGDTLKLFFIAHNCTIGLPLFQLYIHFDLATKALLQDGNTK